LVEANHRLPNDAGDQGFIDILARDRLNNLVIIELKRSDPSAREALFEMLKYLPLSVRLHGVPAQSAASSRRPGTSCSSPSPGPDGAARPRPRASASRSMPRGM
jgi:hypothetical protein